MSTAISLGQQEAAIESLRNMIRSGGTYSVKIYKGAVPTSVNDAVLASNLLVELTGNGSTTPAKRKVTVTPTAASNTRYALTIYGVEIAYTSDSSGTEAEITAKFTEYINALGLDVVAVDNSTDFTVEAYAAGYPFSCVSTGTGTLTIEETVADAPGIHFNDADGSGALTMLAGESWHGVVGSNADGVAPATHWRMSPMADDGEASATIHRLAGDVALPYGSLVTTVNGVATTVFSPSDVAVVNSCIIAVPSGG
jgi:hypothetical protein